MPGNDFEIKSGSKFETDSLSTESELVLQNLVQDSKELQDEIQYFEYKNRSRNGEYYVFSYYAVTGENVDNIRQKYVDQYGGESEGILITDEVGKELSEYEFSQPKKIYLKVKINVNPKPINFEESGVSSKGKQYTCHIETKGWTPVNIRQIYQDETNMVVERDRFIISDGKENIYDDSKIFEPGDLIRVDIKNPDSSKDNKTIHTMKASTKENKQEKQKNADKKTTTQIKSNKHVEESQERTTGVNNYKAMIEKQNGPITMGNRNRSEISITFDDGYGTDCIKHVLDTLKGSGIKATFFILGDCLRNYPELWKRAANEGHQICCHTFSHIYLSDSSDVTSLKKIDVKSRENNVKSLLGVDYYNRIKAESGAGFPGIIKSNILLKTEILMWEAQIKKTLGNDYLKKFKQNYPFFRFPGGCGARRSSNIAVLKSLGYLSIGWSEDFYKGTGKSRRHMTTSEMQNMSISNGDIPLFHFKKDDYRYIDAYIENMKRKGKSSKVVSRVISK